PGRPGSLWPTVLPITCRTASSTCSRRSIMNVEITGLTRRFGRTTAVAGVDLRAGPGVFGLLGPNGAGKTSLLRMMATAVPPTSGRLRLLGRDPGSYGQRREIRRRLGYLPQHLGYYPGFTVAEFVEYFALLKEMPPARIPAAVATAVERVELGGKAKARLRTLSRGMLRRGGGAQAILNKPELLLLDQPTAGPDPEQRVTFPALLPELGRAARRAGPRATGDVPGPPEGPGPGRHRGCQHALGRRRRRRLHRGRADGPGKDRLPRLPRRPERARRRTRHRRRPAGARVQRSPRGGAVMTAASAPAPPRPLPATRRPGFAAARLLRLELRHNAMPWMLPVAIALFWLTTYRKTMAMPPLWNLRAAGMQSGVVVAFVCPVAGAAAWMGSREARRRTADLVTITAQSRWARQLATWAATTGWAMVGYLGCVGVLYGVPAQQAAWGGPLWWPAAVGAASLPVMSALGFAAGALVPSRFTAPLVAIAAFFALVLSTELIHRSQSYWQGSP